MPGAPNGCPGNLILNGSGVENRKDTMTDNQRDKRVEKIQTKILFQVPFFAPAVCRLPVVWTSDPANPTACTNGEHIEFDRAFYDGLSDNQTMTVLCHEAMHCLLGHIWRIPVGGDWETWNKATDHAVNLALKEFSEQVIAKKLADPFPFPDPPEAFLANPAFKGFNEEKIYQMLANQNPPGGQPGGNPGGGKGGQGQGQGQGQSKPGNKPGQGQGKPDPHSMPTFGQIKKPANPDPAAQKKAKSNWDETLVQCCNVSKGRGDLPGGMARFVDELMNPKVAWYELVRTWLREKADDDWNWMKPNVYFNDSEFILPSLDSERMGKIVFATDTSGSIDREALAHFQTEKQNCLDDLRPSALVDIYCDTKIHKVAEFKPGDMIDRDAPGGGGTSFVDVFDYADKLPEVPKCLVYLTDLDGTFPDKAPAYPVLWVTYGTKKQAPFGDTVPIE